MEQKFILAVKRMCENRRILEAENNQFNLSPPKIIILKIGIIK